MSLYNMIFGTNPLSGALLAMVGQTPESVGRFRDAFVIEHEGEPVIGIYTRNGGGNRECCHGPDPGDGLETCKHHAYANEVDEYVNLPVGTAPPEGHEATGVFFTDGTTSYRTGRKVLAMQYGCLAPNSIECGCTGCIANYRLPNAPGYLWDADDEGDCTYATFYFKAPDKYRELLLDEQGAATPGANFTEFLQAFTNPPPEPTTRPQRLAVEMLANIKRATANHRPPNTTGYLRDADDEGTSNAKT